MQVFWALLLLAALDQAVAPVDFLARFPGLIYVTAPGAPLGGLTVHQHLFASMAVPAWFAAWLMALAPIPRSYAESWPNV